jgi:2'-5' RNA ligase
MRLFVSVDLPASLTERVAAVQDELGDASGLRFTDPGQAHVTLAFLGDVAEADVPAVEAALQRAVGQAGVPPFEATVGGLGAFPSLDDVRVVWVGFEAGSEELTRLHDAVAAALEPLGYEREDREFTPHVTVARTDHAGDTAAVRSAVRERSPRVGDMTVAEIRLTESALTDDGPVYATVASAPLPE